MRSLGLLGALLFSGCASFGAAHSTESIVVRCEPLALDRSDPARQTVGRLEYRGGLRLESGAPRFGGWSGFAISPDGRRLLAVSDEGGGWLSARLSYDRRGSLSGLRDARVGLLRDTAGQPISAKGDSDAESLVRLPGGDWLVSFERRHRLWRYPNARASLARAARELSAPDELQSAPPNGGLEAVTALHDGRLLALSEELADGTRRVGWLGRAGAWQRLSYEPAPDFAPADAATLPSGDVLVLERAYSRKLGARARLVRVAAETLVPGAHLSGELLAELSQPLQVDNFEGVAARRGPRGETLVYLLSDDNFDREGQRTLLLLFSLRESSAPPVAPP